MPRFFVGTDQISDKDIVDYRHRCQSYQERTQNDTG